MGRALGRGDDRERRPPPARRATTAVLVLASMLALLVPGLASAQEPRGVLLVDSYGLSGLGDRRAVTASTRDLSTVGFDDRTSALQVRGGIAVAVYSEVAYGGRCQTFVGTDVDLRDDTIGDDAISSVRIGHTCEGYVGGEAVVRDLVVARGTTPASAACPAGYDRKPADLNEGTDGLALFLCVRWGERRPGVVLPFTLRVSAHPPPESYARDCSSRSDDDSIRTGLVQDAARISGDLNEGASTTSIYRHIYLCTVGRVTDTGPLSGPVLKDIDFIVGDDDIAPDEIEGRCRARMGTQDATGDDRDLNEGAGGAYVHACWSTVDAVPFAQSDVTAPDIELESISPPAGDDGWHSGHVTVTWRCTDAESGVVREVVTWQLSGDGRGQEAFGRCRDLAGNERTDTVTGIDIDGTAPAMTLVSRTPANAAGWNAGPVTVTWACADALSGAEAATVTTTLTADGADQTAAGTCRDGAGNTATDAVTGVDIDRTAPTVTWTGVAPSYRLLDTVAVTCAAADALSGVATTTCAPVTRLAWTFGPGDTVLTAAATDRAGNPQSATATVRVTVTHGDLCELTRRFLDGSSAGGAGAVARDLCGKLSLAGTTPNADLRRSLLAAYVKQVQAQTPRLLTAAQAATLVRFAAAL